MTDSIASPSSPELQARWKAETSRQALRAAIKNSVGDHQSVLGDTADLAQLLLVELAKMSEALNNATTLKEVRTAGTSMNTVLAPTLERLQSGETRFPYQVKNEPHAVLSDIEGKATEIAELIKNSKP